MKELIRWVKDVGRENIVSLKSRGLIETYMLQNDKPTLVVLFSGNDRDDGYKYDIIEKICEDMRKDINCAEITPKDQIYKGSHKFFKAKEEKTLIGLVRDHMTIGYTLEEPYERLNCKFFIN